MGGKSRISDKVAPGEVSGTAPGAAPGENAHVPAGTSVVGNALIWFGAAVSIAEILTGTLFAPLGLERGIAAILLGHVIGCSLFCLAGLIGAQERMSAMETARISFGRRGATVFSVANVAQLIGWTAVMIVSGASAAQVIAPIGSWAWCIIIGAFIFAWVAAGIKSITKVNIVAVVLLLLLTALMSQTVFGAAAAAGAASGAAASGASAGGAISFGAAVELGVAMPLSWLPLVSDYTREAARPKAATLASTAAYFIGSCWMYIIGMAVALVSPQGDIASLMVGAGFGLAGLLIVVFSTVTTTFLDAYSAGVSMSAAVEKADERKMAMLVCIIGTLLAIFTPIENYEGFLYLIGSVFAPMVAILISDHFILKRSHVSESLCVPNMVLWIAGFVLYRVFMGIDTPVGNTLPVMAIIVLASVVVAKSSDALSGLKQEKGDRDAF